MVFTAEQATVLLAELMQRRGEVQLEPVALAESAANKYVALAGGHTNKQHWLQCTAYSR
jgi:hypothetical protein